MPRRKNATADIVVHLMQILALMMFGLAIYSQGYLDGIGIAHETAMEGSFWALVVSLAYEHFVMVG